MFGAKEDVCVVESRGFSDDRVIDEMSEAEESHWWYDGLRDLLSRLLRDERFALPPDAAVLDAGCGTGANLRLIQSLVRPAHLEGFDVHPRAIEWARAKCPTADIHPGDICDPKPHRLHYDLVLSCDVVSLVGLAACRGGLRRIAERLKPGGLLILHLPACPRIYSEHDRAVGNIERYRLDKVVSLLGRLRLSVELATYRMCRLFPLIAAARFFRRARSIRPRSDLGGGPTWLQAVWRRIVSAENRLTVRGRRWPIGSSIVAVARRT